MCDSEVENRWVFLAPACDHGVGRGKVEENVIGERKSRKLGPRYDVSHIYIYSSKNWGERITLDQWTTH